MNLTEIKHIAPKRTAENIDGVRLSKDGLKALAMDSARLEKMGIGVPRVSKSILNDFGYAMDSALVNPVTTPTAGVPVQYLQQLLQGVVYVLTTSRKADLLAEKMTVGKWSDAQIVQRELEQFGVCGVYKDHGDIPLASWNLVAGIRDIVRFELGCEVQLLENDRGQAIDINTANEKRQAVAIAFEQLRNDIFFNGFASPNVRCYGMLNDPSLPAYVTVAQGKSNKTPWDDKTVNEIISDILTAIQVLIIQSGGNIDVESESLNLAIPLGANKHFTKVDGGNSFGFTVNKWLAENYPNIKVISVPQFIKANGGSDVFYLYPDVVGDSGTDGGEVMLQLVPAQFQPLNTVQTMKGYAEGYTSAYAGCLVKRPYAVTRFTGI